MKKIFIAVFLIIFIFLLLTSHFYGLFSVAVWKISNEAVQRTNPISSLFIRNDSEKLANIRGILVSKSIYGIWMWSKDGLMHYTIEGQTNLVCLPETSRDIWIDLSLFSDPDRQIYDYTVRPYSDFRSVVSDRSTQIIYSKYKDNMNKNIIWVIGCGK